MKKKNFFLCALALTGALALASCGGNNSNVTSNTDLVSTSASEVTTTNNENENENVVEEDEFFETHTANDYQRNADTSNLDIFVPSLKQKLMISKAFSDLSFTSFNGFISNSNSSYYQNNLHEYKHVTKCSGKLYSNDVIDYTLDFKTTMDGQDYFMPYLSSSLVKASSLSGKVPYGPMGNYTENVTCAYYNNYIYSHREDRSSYENYESNNVQNKTMDYVLSSLKSNLNLGSSSLSSMGNMYKIDDNHFVTTVNYSDSYLDGTITIGYDESDNAITDMRMYSYETKGSIYLSYFNDVFYVDYVYMNGAQKSNYIVDNSSSTTKYVNYKDMVTLETHEMEIVLNHNKVGEYEKKTDFVNSFNKVLSVDSTTSTIYSPTYNSTTNAIESISQYTTSSAQNEVVSKTANSINLNLVYTIDYSEKLFSLGFSLDSDTLNAKISKGEALASSETTYTSESYSANLDLSKVELPEGFSLVTFEGKTYLKSPSLSSKSYYVFADVTATVNETTKTLNCTVNSVDFIEMQNNTSYKKVAVAKDIDSILVKELVK